MTLRPNPLQVNRRHFQRHATYPTLPLLLLLSPFPMWFATVPLLALPLLAALPPPPPPALPLLLLLRPLFISEPILRCSSIEFKCCDIILRFLLLPLSERERFLNFRNAIDTLHFTLLQSLLITARTHTPDDTLNWSNRWCQFQLTTSSVKHRYHFHHYETRQRRRGTSTGCPSKLVHVGPTGVTSAPAASAESGEVWRERMWKLIGLLHLID